MTLRDEPITVWTTACRRNQKICRAFAQGLAANGVSYKIRPITEWDGTPRPSVSYGFLRGIDRVYRNCERAGVDWWNIDKGFFGVKHTSGYYRVGYRHLQPRFVPTWEASPTRWTRLGISIRDIEARRPGFVLVCPPTQHIAAFYGIDADRWIADALAEVPEALRSVVVVRRKGDLEPLDRVLAQTRLVVTHSSNVALEALVSGVQAVATDGFLRSWITTGRGAPREQLFYQAAGFQYTLREFASGHAWRKLSKIWRHEDQKAAVV